MLSLIAFTSSSPQEVPGGLCNPAPPISAAISTLPELEDLTIALQTAGTDSDGVLSSPQSAPVVLVAPTNDAFNVLAEALNAPVEALLNEAGVMRTILGYHLIKNGNCDGKLSVGTPTRRGKGNWPPCTRVPTYSLALTHSRTRALHSFVPPPGCCDDGPQRRDADLWCVLTSTAERSHDPTLSLALRSSLFALRSSLVCQGTTL